jgi:hypothetical protein
MKDLTGKLDWTGDWSYKSDKWTPELKAHMSLDQIHSLDEFYMSFDDFFSYFNSSGISKLHLNKNSPFN